MKVAIRLQNHGCANHPYWWIVVASHRTNLKGRFIEHVGYWQPNVSQTRERQITLNLPRIKYWMGCGAVPTPRVQNFLNLWGLMPRPFYPQHSEAQLAARRKPESQWTDKDRKKQQRKQKSRAREKLAYINYLKPFAKYKSLQTYQFQRHMTKIREKIQAAQKQNQILRELLLHNEFVKANRINELSGGVILDDTAELLRLEGELARAKTELALLEKSMKQGGILQQVQVIKEINGLVEKIRDVEKQSAPFRTRGEKIEAGENVSKATIDRQIEYELVTRKLDEMNKELELLDRLYEVVTLEEYANYVQIKDPELRPQECTELAQEYFIERGERKMPPLTRYQLYYSDELSGDPNQLLEFDEEATFQRTGWKTKVEDVKVASETPAQATSQAAVPQPTEQKEGQQTAPPTWQRPKNDTLWQKYAKKLKMDLDAENTWIDNCDEQNLLKHLFVRPDVVVPTNRPVHPFPDLTTYVPEEYYQPISDLNLKVVHLDSLEPNDELKKYHVKRQYQQPKASKPKRKQGKNSSV